MGNWGLGDHLGEKLMVLTHCSLWCCACFVSDIWATPNSHFEWLDHREERQVIPLHSLPWNALNQQCSLLTKVKSVLPTLVTFWHSQCIYSCAPQENYKRKNLEKQVEPPLSGQVKGASAVERFGWAFVGKYLNILDLEPLKETLEPPTTVH